MQLCVRLNKLARKRKGKGKGRPKTKARTPKQNLRRRRIKAGAKLAAIGGAYALAHAAGTSSARRAGNRRRAASHAHTRAYA